MGPKVLPFATRVVSHVLADIVRGNRKDERIV